MGKDEVNKINFRLKNTSKFYLKMQEMPMVLSKCNLPPRTFMMTDIEFDTYFAGINHANIRKEFLKCLNQCTGIVGESILDSTAKKAWFVQHTALRLALIEQARMLSECMAAVNAKVTQNQIEVQRKVELAKFQLLLTTEPTEKYYLNNLFTKYDDCWEQLESLGQQTCRIMRNECGCWTICF